MRARPADSLAYLGEMALGKVAPLAAGAVVVAAGA
jgi:hypothetical protein